MSTPRRLASCVLALLVVLSPALPARAAGPPAPSELAQARAMSRKGLEHFRAGRWVEARSLFREALAARELSSLHYYLGACEAQLGADLLAAREHFEKALASAAEVGESAESAATKKTVLEGARAGLREIDARLPSVVVRWAPGEAPPGATLMVDGGQAMTSDEVAKGPLRLNPSEHRLLATAPGKRPFETIVRLAEGQSADVTLRLEPEAPAVPRRVESAPAEPASASWQRPVGYVGLGLGAALLGAGAFSSLRVASLNDRLSSGDSYVAYRSGFAEQNLDVCALATQGQGSPTAGAATPSQVRGTCDDRARFETLQYVFYGAGALAVGAGAYFAFLAPTGRSSSQPRRTATWHVAPSVGPGTARFSLGVTF